MPFPWLDRTQPRPDGAARRAAVLDRLGFSEAAAARRNAAAVAWESDPEAPPAHRRPAALSVPAIARIVPDAFARRPG